MTLKLFPLTLLLGLLHCSTVDFIPEPEYTAYNSQYKKKSWEDVEVWRGRPNRSFNILGEIVIRNESEKPWEILEIAVKKEMWDRKMDGIWLVDKKQQKVDGFSLETMDTRGHTTSNYNSENTMRVWQGFAFRYK